MENNEVIARHLEETGAYADKETPVLLTSGESLTPFFVNAEKLCRDEDISAFLKENGDSSKAIIDHAAELAGQHIEFSQDIAILVEKAKELFTNKDRGLASAISGGQRRDWIFSGPVARQLDVPHISLYKQEDETDKIEIVYPDGRMDLAPAKLPYYTVHVVDLLTKGSSCYDNETGVAKGWIPMARNKDAHIRHLIAVVTRLQKGEENLAEQDVTVHAQVGIDADFLQTHSKQADIAAAYVADEKKWTMAYLDDKGIGILVPYFEPGSKSLSRGIKFLRHYGDLLDEEGHRKKLDAAVQEKYSKPLSEIVGGN